MRWTSVKSPAHRSAIIELAEAAARGRPDVPALQLTWAEALGGAGEQEEALRRLEAACRRFPDHEPLHAGYADALMRAERHEAALAIARRWSASGWAAALTFKLLMRERGLGRLAEHEAALAKADPADPDLLDYRAAKWRDAPEALLAACDAVLAHDPRAIHAVYHKAVALAQLGRADEASALMAIDRFVRRVRLPVPPGFPDEEEFLSALRVEIETNKTLHADPAGHATRQGLRTQSFPIAGDRAGTALVSALKRAVAGYAAGLEGSHPFVAARPAQARFTVWALLFGADGHQSIHHHAGPWMTGVYYVTAPQGDGANGALRIGSLPEWLGVRPPWPVLDVRPDPGTLVMFPSFVPHETIPTGSGDIRISVAFDVAGEGR